MKRLALLGVVVVAAGSGDHDAVRAFLESELGVRSETVLGELRAPLDTACLGRLTERFPDLRITVRPPNLDDLFLERGTRHGDARVTRPAAYRAAVLQGAESVVIADDAEDIFRIPVNVVHFCDPAVFLRGLDAVLTGGNQRKNTRTFGGSDLGRFAVFAGRLQRQLHLGVQTADGKRRGATGKHSSS